MINYKVYLEKYDWEVECIINNSDEDVQKILCKLDKLDCGQSVLEKSYENLIYWINSGLAYSNVKERKSLMVINKSISMDEFINTYNHEKNHIEMHICEELHIDPYSEEAAHLSGDLAELLFSKMLDHI